MKYLFDEKQTPEGMVSVSQIQTYLSCRKKWEYNYVENIKPRVERSYLTIGKLCHKGMQAAMQSIWKGDDWTVSMTHGVTALNNEWQNYIDTVPLLDEEIPDINKMHEDAINVFTQAFEEFEPWKYEVLTIHKDGEPIPALELHFCVPCPPTNGLHGFIDAILKDKETGFIWCTDYKFRKSLAPDEDEAFNIQNAVYAYACREIGIEITGTMTWQHLNTPTSNPAILKDGKISRAKIKTTWERYRQFCYDNGQDPEDYRTEMEEKLQGIEWYRSTYEYRNDETINNIWNDCILPTAEEIKASYQRKNYKSLYPWNCKMCQYQSLCQAELRNYDVNAIKLREYTVRG